MSKWTPGDDRGGDPQPGLFLMRLVRGGPQIAARITCTDGQWQATVDGKPYPPHSDPVIAQHVYRVWHSGIVITQGDYDYRLAVKAWATDHQPGHPCLSPYQAVDISLLPPISF